MTPRLSLIGSGNVATHLGKALTAVQVPVQQVLSRNAVQGKALSDTIGADFTTDFSQLHPETELCILAVSDDAVATVAAQLPKLSCLLVHTSGAVPMQQLATYGARIGVFYPLQTFSKDRTVDFAQLPVCIESAQENDLPLLESLARRLSPKCYQVDSEQRKMLHLAAVFVNNFTNHMYQIGAELLAEARLPMDLLHPLMEETAQKAQTGLPKDWQTGPARRGDERVLKGHEQLLSEHPDFQKIYTLVSQSILRSSSHE
ncbi:MAG: Rossmann-like and DUF2520 domain-containing protein [Salibacteraceae bacterium]